MPVQYIGYRIEGFYKMTSSASQWEGIMGSNAEQKLDALFWDKHGLHATRDAFQVSRSSLYRWRKVYDEAGASAMHDRSGGTTVWRLIRWCVLSSAPAAVCVHGNQLRQPFCLCHGSPTP